MRPNYRKPGSAILLTITGAMTLAAVSHAQVTIVGDARTWALSEATVALSGHPGAFNTNPATVGFGKLLQVSTNIGTKGVFGTHWGRTWSPFEEEFVVSAPSIDYRTDEWAFAYAATYFYVGTYPVRDDENNPVGEERSYRFDNTAVVAYQINSRTSIGVAVSFIYHDLALAVGRAVSIDLGILREWSFFVGPVGVSPSIAWSLTDFGPKMRYRVLSKYDGVVEAKPDPDALDSFMRAGASVLVSTTQTHGGRPYAGFRLLAGGRKSMIGNQGRDGPIRSLVTAWESKLDSWDLSNPRRVNAFGQIVWSVGAELNVLGVVYLRWGRFHEPRIEGNRQFETYGVGLDFHYVVVDYARIPDDAASLSGQSFMKLTGRIPLGRD